MKILIAIVVIIAFFWIRAVYRKKRRPLEFAKRFPVFKRLVADGRHDEAITMLQEVSVLRRRYKLEPAQRHQITVLEIECLERLDRVPEAVVYLAVHLASVYEIGEWPQDLLSKWISLYQSCAPINVEEFYFCQTCGLHPNTKALLRYAIKEKNCKPPIGFPGNMGSGQFIELGLRKV